DMGAMTGAHGRGGAQVKSRQELAKERDEARRKEVAGQIEKIFGETKKSVEDKLVSLEADVSKMFDEGLDKALKDMRDDISTRKDRWKDDRYGGIVFNFPLWGYDKLRGIDEIPAIKQIYVDGNKKFTDDLDALVVKIANLVEARLKDAKDEVAKGEKRIHEYVECLPKDLQEVGSAAEKEVSSRFDELRQTIDDKKSDLAQSLAQRYKEAHDKADEAIKELQAEDKGLVSAFLDKLAEIIEILRNFRRRVMALLKKAEDTIDLIVADPIGFLKNMLAAIKRGLNQFIDHIGEHLEAGFIEWLLGSLAEMGITLPKDFSLPSIFKLVLDVLGITYDKIRGKVVKIIGERNMALLEAAWDLVKALITGGPAALWEKVKEYLGNIKEMVIDAIQEWLITTIIKSAVTKLATMFNPVGAIIQAILLIYNTVMFFVERINQILAFVESIINSAYKIATGAIGDAADWIEKALARTIPIIIGFLARLLGLSGLTEKIKGFILKVQTKVDHAIDKVIDKIVGGVKALFAAGKAVVGKVVAWWKRKREFTSAEGHAHTLFFTGEEETAALMVASSRPKGLADLIDERLNATPAPDPKEEAELKLALAAHKNLLQTIRQHEKKTKAAGAAETTSLASAIDAGLVVIAGHLAKTTLDPKKLPLSNVTYQTDGKRAKHVLADPLTQLPGNTKGTPPTEPSASDIPAWKMMGSVQRPAGYIRMHLVSHQYHGPGMSWNLVVAPQTVNKGWVYKIETDVQKLLKAGKTLRFTADVEYTHPAPTQDFPSKVTFNWGEKGQTLQTKGEPINPPTLLGAAPAVSAPDLDTAPWRDLQLMGFRQAFAQGIVNARVGGGFADFNDFKTRVDAAVKVNFPGRGYAYYRSDLLNNISKFSFKGAALTPGQI
ncbi:MAG: hypothetical protein WCD76_04500, partial [Pyrinomonadaceae bacterium]